MLALGKLKFSTFSPPGSTSTLRTPGGFFLENIPGKILVECSSYKDYDSFNWILERIENLQEVRKASLLVTLKPSELQVEGLIWGRIGLPWSPMSDYLG